MDSSEKNSKCDVCSKDVAHCQCATKQVASASSDGERPGRQWIVADRYRIIEEIGSGGMGTVYKAEHALLGSYVALKTLNPELLKHPAVAMRFQREARACASLSHPGIVAVHDCGVADSGQPYLAMEFVEGKDLSELIETTDITLDRFKSIFSQVANAMDYSHRHGVTHRDLKPSNLLLTQGENGREQCVVVDFGVAKSNTKAASSKC